jgi:hypothetical protein
MRTTYLGVSLVLFCYMFYGMIIYKSSVCAAAASLSGLSVLHFRKEEDDNENTNDDTTDNDDDICA